MDFLVDFKDAKKNSKNGIIGFRAAARMHQDAIYGGGGPSQLRIEETEIRIEETKSEVTGI